jgi:hypothetical protein
MNSKCKRWLVGAVFAVAVSAVFFAVLAQDDDEEESLDFGASMQNLEAPASGTKPEQSATEEPAPAVAAQEDDSAADGAGGNVAKSKDKSDSDDSKGSSTPIFSKPSFELNLGMATVNGQPWTRIALGVDLPIWKFGVFLDLELFIDDESKVSNKGWDFKDNATEAVFRKIRYIRYGHEDEPLFVKFGGLSNVTIGYGMIVDRFTNMLRYPDEKLLGLQFYVNDVLPIGLTVQTLISDFAEMKDDGGVYAARVAVRPLKQSGIFLLDGLSVGAMCAVDANVNAPAGKWGYSDDVKMLVEMRDESFFDEYKNFYQDYYKKQGVNLSVDTILSVYDKEENLRDKPRPFTLLGLDAGLPIIKTDILGIDLYGQWAVRADTVPGWGLGAPGVAVRFWRLTGDIEYRKVEGKFTPGYFDTYYLDERYSRGLMKSKDEYIDSLSVNGVFGRLGMDVFGVLSVSGSYLYMLGENQKSQSYEGTAGIGETIMSRIPKISLAEVYVRNANIGLYDKYDKNGDPVYHNKNSDPPVIEKAWLFDRSPGMYWGYRMGFEITSGASLIWDYRYGWKVENGKLVSDNHMLLQTALRF